MIKSLRIIIILFTSFQVYAQKENFSFHKGENYKLAEFRFWNPNVNDNYKGILVLNPGFNGDGRKAVLDTDWQKFAIKHNLSKTHLVLTFLVILIKDILLKWFITELNMLKCS